MAECCCTASFVKVNGHYSVSSTADLAREAIDANNKKFFEMKAKYNDIQSIADVSINGKFTVLEYAVKRDKIDLLSYLLDDSTGWGIEVLKQDAKKLYDLAKGKNNIQVLVLVTSVLEGHGINTDALDVGDEVVLGNQSSETKCAIM